MENILKVLVLSFVFACYLVVATYGDFESVIQCVEQQGLTKESTWACGYCLDVDAKGNKLTVKGLKMNNKSECENQKENGE